MTVFERFLRGFRTPWRGLRLLFSTPKLWIYSLPPFLISGAALILGFALIYQQLPVWLMGLLPDPVGFLGFTVHWLGMFLGVFFAIIALGLVTLALVQIVAIPFNALLAEKALHQFGGFKSPDLTLQQWLTHSLRLFRVSAVKSILFLCVALVLFVLSLIPGIQILAVTGGLYLAACDCTDYSLEAKGLGLQERLRFFRKAFWELLGFAATLGAIFLIPGLNLFFFPSAIVGGALLVLELDWAQK